ncbi:MAG: lysophospholipid acyltransferase family protein [Holophagaceae bacterium]
MPEAPAGVQIAERGRPLGSPLSVWLQFRLVPFLAAHLVKLLAYTLRVRYEGLAPVEDLVAGDRRFILAFWHRRLAMMPLAYPFRRRGRGVAILSSDSKDGERSAATWRWFGIHAVRGTAADDGAKALVRMIRAVKEGWDFGITPDGPKGPRQKLKPGVLALAKKTGAWIVPVCVSFDRFVELKTWDAMVIPMPFATCTVTFGEPAEAATLTEEALEIQLNFLEAKALAGPA